MSQPQPRTRLSATVIGAPDPRALGAFYARLLEWEIVENDDAWVMITPPDGGTGLSFQLETGYVPPVWPAGPDDQQMMMHLDIGVDDLAAGVAWALAAGATQAAFQPQEVDDLAAGVAWALAAGATQAAFQPQEDVRVMLDPVGHPFCLFAVEF